MTPSSQAVLLTLHAVRVLGFADAAAVARRYELDAVAAGELLLDAQANGWVTHAEFAGTAGWSLTERGRAVNETQLAAELTGTGRVREVRGAYERFLPMNAVVLKACTDWQLRPTAGDRLAANDHADPVWDGRMLSALHGIAQDLTPLIDQLSAVLVRFRGYDARFSHALMRARAGDHPYIDRSDVDSCHRVWFELHEDLVATLGIDRQAAI